MGHELLGFLPDRVWDVLVAAPISIILWVAIARATPGIMERWNERRRILGEEKAADYHRLREENERLSNRIEALEASNADLRKEIEQIDDGRLHWKDRAIVAESQLLGAGFVRQAAAEAGAEARRDQKKDGGEP